MKKLPIGIQSFKIIREEDYIYIDKTKEALDLITNYKYVFLSRPRRFGKSLFLDTLKHIFEGNKGLFKGLYIYDKWDFEAHPVIKISWAGDFTTLDNLKARAKNILKTNQEYLGIECEDDYYLPNCFDELIKKTYKKFQKRVIVLIDEYDKPILDVIENETQAKINREFIKSLYTILKDNDEYLQFVFLTGVSKFSKASIFSGLNMLEDISFSPRFGNICGYTQSNIENEFREYLKGVDLNKVKEWYNGYYFLKDKVYNPFDILQFIKNEFVYRNYWFESGTPTFLLKLIEKNNYLLPKLSNLVVGEELLNSFDVENIKLEVILYQAGYLTIEKMIQKRNRISYKLKLSNKEVKISISNYILEFLFNHTNGEKTQIQDSLYDALENANLEDFKKALISIFASIPYTNYTNSYIQNYEGFYASIVYVYLQSLGIEIIGEDVTNIGRIDLTIFIEDKIYIMEFKVIDKGERRVENRALIQIKEKKYYKKYLNKNKEIYLLGIEFDKTTKNILNFAWEKMENL